MQNLYTFFIFETLKMKAELVTWLVVAFFSLSSTDVAIRVVTLVALTCGVLSPLLPSCGSAFQMERGMRKPLQ